MRTDVGLKVGAVVHTDAGTAVVQDAISKWPDAMLMDVGGKAAAAIPMVAETAAAMGPTLAQLAVTPSVAGLRVEVARLMVVATAATTMAVTKMRLDVMRLAVLRRVEAVPPMAAGTGLSTVGERGLDVMNMVAGMKAEVALRLVAISHKVVLGKPASKE